MPTPAEPPAIRILPMSDQLKGFRNRSIPHIQTHFFLDRLPARKGRFHYPSSGLKAPAGALVLFQFQARIIASAIFRYNEKFEHPLPPHAGILHFDPASIRIFTPLDLPAMRRIWPRFHAFGHAKQSLNPAAYPTLQKHHLASAKSQSELPQ